MPHGQNPVKQPANPSGEQRIETRLRKRRLTVPAITLVVAVGLVAGIGWCQALFEIGAYWVVIPAGLLAHAFLIIVVHDGAHRSITTTKADSWLMNIGAGLMLLPFYGEPFRRSHLIHHAHTNVAEDPLWPPFKRRLYENHRLLYMLGELVPLLFSLLVLAFPAAQPGARPVAGPRVRYRFLGLSFAVAVATCVFVRPPVWFLFGTALSLNLWASIRHWCEHLGLATGKESNTFRFPLGMGIGNHEAHHTHPGYSWISMAVGLWQRPKETGPIRTVLGMLFLPRYRHYDALWDAGERR